MYQPSRIWGLGGQILLESGVSGVGVLYCGTEYSVWRADEDDHPLASDPRKYRHWAEESLIWEEG